jgi:serine/threonine protein kinase
MNVERWQKVKFILEESLELTQESRSDFLAEYCNGDEDLRREVENLLEFEYVEADPLEQAPFSAFTENYPASKNVIGRQIGKYEIIDKLGTGGMGAVFLAERADGAFSQRVALKLIKRGMDSDAVLRRFLNERQILAALKHPNIAHLIDGGTTDDNLPFFVMEHVEGETISAYAEKENLDLEVRLKLFCQVCAAVSFAHSNLVIHRDLKPSNILVTKDGSVKLLDFGIAKLLRNDANGETATRNFVFTPEYASPEQVKGEKLTTATDVYSLGIILYELLTGNRPYQTESKNISEIILAVCETEPTPPSAALNVESKKDKKTTNQNKQKTPHHSAIRIPRSGDLDNIILKALRKEPERRYSSVEKLREDIRRHLEGLPVTASRDTWKYRASKFVHRNRIGVVAAVVILLTLFAGLAATLYQTNVARRERAKAEQRFNDVRQLANSFMFEINDQLVKSPIKARELLVQRAVEYLDKLASEAANDIELQSELATAYEKIGDVQTELFKPNLGKTSDALVSHQKALQLREKLFSAEPNAPRGIDVANSYLRVGDIFMMIGQIAETRENYQRAIQILESLIASDSTNFAVRRKLGSGYGRLGQAILRSGSLNEALANYEKSLKIFQNLQAENPDNLDVERSVGIVFSFIAFVKMETGKTEEAVEYYGKWLETEKKFVAADKNNVVSRGGLASAHTWFGIILTEQGKQQEAIAHLTEGVRIQEEIFEADKENFGERMSLADGYLEFGKILAKYNQTNEAIKMLEKSVEHYQAILETDRESLWTKQRVAASQRYLAGAFLQKGNFQTARRLSEESLTAYRELIAADANNSEWQLDLALCYLQTGEFYLKMTDKTNALANFEKSLPIFEKLAANSPENIKRQRDLETIKSHLAQLKI